MKILLINSAPQTKEFVDPIMEVLNKADIFVKLINYNEIPSNLALFDGVIISASPRGDDIVDAHIPYYQWIKNFQKPILGICHGHQFIGVMYGAKLIRDEQSEEGEFSIDIKENNPLFNGFTKSFKVEQHHNNSITLPEDFKLLASSERCEVQVMGHKEMPLYTAQFHAEKNPDIILNFIKIAEDVKSKKTVN